MPVLITIDTETSSGCTGAGCVATPLSGRVFGLNDGRVYGIALIMDLLEKHSMRGTFFVNAYLDSAYPDQEISDMVQSIVSRGHDVQLHTHPEFRCFRRCAAAEHACWARCRNLEGRTAGTSFDNQLEVLREGALNIQRWSGRYPVAFRGGALKADVTTLRALKALDIRIDSSLSGPGHELASVLPVNQLTMYEGVLEIPLLAYVERLPFSRRVRFLDQQSSILEEQVELLDQASEMGVGAVPLIMHSFSFCDPAVACPIPNNIRRFDELLGHLARSPDRFQVMTMTDFWGAYQRNPAAYLGSTTAMPEVGYWLVLRRSLVRYDQGWMNLTFLLANLIALLSLLFITTLLIRRKWLRRVK